LSQHTPGPWVAEDRRKAALPNIRVVCGEKEVAQMSHVHMRDHRWSDGWTNEQADAIDMVGLANARLIAKSPEMHAFLERVVSQCHQGNLANDRCGDECLGCEAQAILREIEAKTKS
jgi:hypothetical protein